MSPTNDQTVEDYPDLREALKRCSPATYHEACKFRQTGASEHLRAVVAGVVERYVERELRPRMIEPHDQLRLREDLGLDSLTMMEIVMLAEEILPITASNEELGRLRTVADVEDFCEKKVREVVGRTPSLGPAAERKLEPPATGTVNGFAR